MRVRGRMQASRCGARRLAIGLLHDRPGQLNGGDNDEKTRRDEQQQAQATTSEISDLRCAAGLWQKQRSTARSSHYKTLDECRPAMLGRWFPVGNELAFADLVIAAPNRTSMFAGTYTPLARQQLLEQGRGANANQSHCEAGPRARDARSGDLLSKCRSRTGRLPWKLLGQDRTIPRKRPLSLASSALDAVPGSSGA